MNKLINAITMEESHAILKDLIENFEISGVCLTYEPTGIVVYIKNDLPYLINYQYYNFDSNTFYINKKELLSRFVDILIKSGINTDKIKIAIILINKPIVLNNIVELMFKKDGVIFLANDYYVKMFYYDIYNYKGILDYSLLENEYNCICARILENLKV